MYMINRVKTVWQFITSPNYSRTVSILALLVVVLAIPLTVFIAQQQQEIRQRAQTTEVLHPVGEITDVSPPSGNAGQQFTVQGHVIATTTDSSSPFYIITKAELWVTKRGIPNPPDQTPQNCPGPVSGIWCRIGFYEGESQHDAFITGVWTALEAGNYLFVVNGFVKSGGQCSGNPVLPAGWEDCGRTGRRDMVELTVGQATAPPPTATPIILPLVTSTPILTPTPTPVALCGKFCRSFASGSKTRVADCDFADTYLDVSETNGVCMGSCAQIPVGYQRTPDKCGAVSTTTGLPRVAAPPSVGDYNPPAPTATPTPGGTQLTLNLILPEGKNQKRVIVQIFGSNNQQVQEVSGTLSSGGGGNYSGTIPIGSIASGAYNIKVKAAKYLKKLISNVQINAGATSSLPQITLKLGDMDGNNELTAADYRILYDCFGNKANTSGCGSDREAADLNDDGRVDGIDYNLFLRSLATEPRQGD